MRHLQDPFNQNPFNRDPFNLDEPGEWSSFPGGELEGKRPKRVCPTCRQGPNTICFRCFRAELDRERALCAAASLVTASEARFQFQLPLQPVNRARLARLKSDRAGDRSALASSVGRPVGPVGPVGPVDPVGPAGPAGYLARRHQAQIAARHALARAAAGLRVRGQWLRLPEAWLPFVVSG